MFSVQFMQGNTRVSHGFLTKNTRNSHKLRPFLGFPVFLVEYEKRECYNTFYEYENSYRK